MDNFVQLKAEEYRRLLDLEEFLICLKACGVDNWEGYDEAVRMCYEDEEEE